VLSLPSYELVKWDAHIMYRSAKPTRIDSFMKLIAPFGILESARTGLMALPRSPLYGPNEQEMLKEADDIVDASTLPPG
jgi:acetolactate synthase-1/3 small subunit